jgi:menaquinone-dependent protoporphyrinogen oxidase
LSKGAFCCTIETGENPDVVPASPLPYSVLQIDEREVPTNMPDSVLVAYATTYGSTREVAEAVAATLRERGLEVALQPMRDVRTLAGYSAVVLGAPLYMFHWHKDARRFLARHRQALAGLPVAIFALGPVSAGDEQEWQSAREQLDKELAKFPWLQPIAVEILGGKLEPTTVRFPASLFMRHIPASDLRDWTAIRAWASNLSFHS